MDTKAAAARPVYKEFFPASKWVREDGFDTLVVELPEFKKEQVQVQLESFGKLNIKGERPLAKNERSRFGSVFQVPRGCNEIHTRFDNGRLYVKTLPKTAEPKQHLVNVVVAVVVLVVMALFLTSKN